MDEKWCFDVKAKVKVIKQLVNNTENNFILQIIYCNNNNRNQYTIVDIAYI